MCVYLITHKCDLKTCLVEKRCSKLKSLYLCRCFPLQTIWKRLIRHTEIKMYRIVGREEHLLKEEMNTCSLCTVTPYKCRFLALLIIVFNILISYILFRNGSSVFQMSQFSIMAWQRILTGSLCSVLHSRALFIRYVCNG